MSRSLQSFRSAAQLASVGSKRSFHSSRIARDHYLNANRETFDKVVSSSSKPLLVQFTATWCQPCRILGPVLQRLTAPGTDYDLVVVDCDEQPELAGEYKVSAVPFVVGFKNGQPKDKFIGMLPEPKIKEFMAKL